MLCNERDKNHFTLHVTFVMKGPSQKAKKLSSLFQTMSKARSSAPKAAAPSSAVSEPSELADLYTTLSTSSRISRKRIHRLENTVNLGGASSNSVSSHGTDLGRHLQTSPSPSQESIMRRWVRASLCKKQNLLLSKIITRSFGRLISMIGEKLGTSSTANVFGKLGRAGIKEYNALIGVCIRKSKTAKDEEVMVEQIYMVHLLLQSMREQGLQLEEETYGQFFKFLIDMEMVEEFKFFCEIVQHVNPNALPRLAYYEMLLWVRLGDEDNINRLCDYIATNDDADNTNIRENYLLALCECERRKELLILLDIIDITKISSTGHLRAIFRSLARLLLESFAKKFILSLKNCAIGAENISRLIYEYALTLPNLAVQDAILKFKSLHEELNVMPASASYEKLIKHCCNLLKVHTALDLIDHMCDTGLTLSMKTFDFILQACEESCDYNLVHRIYLVIRRNNLKPHGGIFRNMIDLCVRMKDFEGAYNMIKDAEKIGISHTASMYNTIMVAHFREKKSQAGLMVLKDMNRALVNPDAWTFSNLIRNCDREEDIIKYYEDFKRTKLPITKHVFMALIHAYASCGLFEKAKQVLLKKGIPRKNLNEVKNVLASVLASHGNMSDALATYEEIKQAGGHAKPKTILYLLEHKLQLEGQLSRLLDLLNELNDTEHWIDGCYSVILYCVKFKDLRSALDLLKQLSVKFYNDEISAEVLFDKVFCKIAEIEHMDLQFGLDILQSIKDEVGLHPSRTSLDFLLRACVGAKDSKTARLIWKEYEAAGLPYNGLTYLRMYQAFLACGEHKSAEKMQKKIPLDDPHVIYVMNAFQEVYNSPQKRKNKKNISKRKSMIGKVRKVEEQKELG